MAFFKEELHKVKAFAFDVDGVLSCSIVQLNTDGELLRTMNSKDGYAIQYAIKRGFPIAIITGGNTASVYKRFANLGVVDIYLSSHNKMPDFQNFIQKHNLSPEDILYMGDDLPDYNVMKICGVPTCPYDAGEEIRAISKYVSDRKGGEGCVRDVIEQTLRVQGLWMLDDAFSW